jgi:hypothetical protein
MISLLALVLHDGGRRATVRADAQSTVIAPVRVDYADPVIFALGYGPMWTFIDASAARDTILHDEIRHYALPLPYFDIMLFGRKRAICGNMMMRMMHTEIAATNGHTPLKMVLSGTSVTVDRRKTLSPIGGVASPISMSSTNMTPNQIGLNPSCVIMG